MTATGKSTGNKRRKIDLVDFEEDQPYKDDDANGNKKRGRKPKADQQIGSQTNNKENRSSNSPNDELEQKIMDAYKGNKWALIKVSEL